MGTSIFLFSLLFFIFYIYVFYIWYNYGVLPSISDSWYVLPQNKKIFFTLYSWGLSFTVFLLTTTIFMYLSALGLLFVGAATAFKNKFVNYIHTIGAIFSILFSQMSIYFDYNMAYVNIISISSILILFLTRKFVKNYLWWIEIIAFIAIIYSLFIDIFIKF